MTAERFGILNGYMESCMQDSAHDKGHIRRVLDAALILARKEKNVEWDVLITAALLHDIGREEQFRTGESHAAVGARMAKDYLLEQGADEAFAQHVSDCIRTHSFRKNDPPATIEAKLIYEADKLDVVGAIGVARTLLYQGRVDDPVYSVGPDGAVLSGDEKEPSFYSEYRHKLMRLPARFLTAEGKKQAARRAERAADFEAALRAETATGEAGSGWRVLPKGTPAKQRRIFNLAQMLAEGNGKASREMLIELTLSGEIPAESGTAGRAVKDAILLDEEGALGIAQRLMEIGRERADMNLIFEEKQPVEYFTSQARGMAKTRGETAQAFLKALSAEMEEYREEAGKILREILG